MSTNTIREVDERQNIVTGISRNLPKNHVTREGIKR
jgi:hypothetical protein